MLLVLSLGFPLWFLNWLMTYRTCGDATMGITASRPGVGSVGWRHTPGTGWFGSPIYMYILWLCSFELCKASSNKMYQQKRLFLIFLLYNKLSLYIFLDIRKGCPIFLEKRKTILYICYISYLFIYIHIIQNTVVVLGVAAEENA